MLFRNPPKVGSRISLIKYLETDLWSWMKELSAGLVKLSFADNFESFRVDDLLIPNGTEVAIPNQFRLKANNIIPSSRIIVRQKPTGAIGNVGNGFVTDGVTPWNATNVFLYNHGPEDTLVSVIFLK